MQYCRARRAGLRARLVVQHAWTVLRGMHKTSGLSAMIISHMLETSRLPRRVRVQVLEYIAEKMSKTTARTINGSSRG